MAIDAPAKTTEFERALAENDRYAAQFDRSGLPGVEVQPAMPAAERVGSRR